ncbi:hypothetical protein KBI33_01480 [Candidatus Shapirobacteria bacterium]|nr:hypothetical protein [Candidatus Shapirobacteria bacterium]
MKNKKNFLLVGGAILGIGVIIGVSFLVKQRQETRTKAAPATTIALEPASRLVRPGDEIDLNVVINTNENVVAAIELHINYATEYLNLKSVAPGSFFSSPVELKKDTSIPGQLVYILGAPPGGPKSGQGVAATLHFLVKETVATATEKNTQISFSPETQAAALQEGGANVIINRSAATLIFAGGITGSPTPTTLPTGISTPTPTPSPTGISTPTPTSGLRASPTPTSSFRAGGSQVQPTAAPTLASSAEEMPVSGLPEVTLGLGGIGVVLLILGLSFLF